MLHDALLEEEGDGAAACAGVRRGPGVGRAVGWGQGRREEACTFILSQGTPGGLICSVAINFAHRLTVISGFSKAINECEGSGSGPL